MKKYHYLNEDNKEVFDFCDRCDRKINQKEIDGKFVCPYCGCNDNIVIEEVVKPFKNIKLVWATTIRKIAKDKDVLPIDRLFKIIQYCEQEEKEINERFKAREDE